MRFVITINQRGKKVKTIETKLDDRTSMETIRKIWEAEMNLNGIPGSDLRFHFNIEDDK